MVNLNQIALFTVVGAHFTQCEGNTALGADEFLEVAACGVLRPAGFIIAAAAAVHLEVHDSVVVGGRVSLDGRTHAPNPGNLLTGEPLCDVSIVHAAIDNRRAVCQQLFITLPVHRMVVLRHTDKHRPSDNAAVNERFDFTVGIIMAQNVRDETLLLCRLDGADKRFAFFERAGNRLFAEDVLAVCKAVLHDRQVGGGVGRNNTDVHVRALQKGTVIGAEGECAEAPCRLAGESEVGVYTRDDADIIAVVNIRQMRQPDMPAADEYDPVGFHAILPLYCAVFARKRLYVTIKPRGLQVLFCFLAGNFSFFSKSRRLRRAPAP